MIALRIHLFSNFSFAEAATCKQTVKKVEPYLVTICSRSWWGWWLVYILFVWSLSSHSRIFHSYGDVIIAGEGLQIFTYARNSWPLSSEGSLTCHAHCDTGLPFIMVISEDPWHSHLMPSVWQWSCHYLFLRLMSVANALHLRHRSGVSILITEKLIT